MLRYTTILSIQHVHFFKQWAYMMSQMALCVAIHWPPNGQQNKCMLHASNSSPHSHVRRLNAKGWIKPRQKHNVEMKIKCVMWNKWIDGLATNHSPTPLLAQKWMQVLDVEQMESSSKINLRDVLWWMSIKDAYKLGVPVTTRLSKERCISLAARRRSSCITRKHD